MLWWIERLVEYWKALHRCILINRMRAHLLLKALENKCEHYELSLVVSIYTRHHLIHSWYTSDCWSNADIDSCYWLNQSTTTVFITTYNVYYYWLNQQTAIKFITTRLLHHTITIYYTILLCRLPYTNYTLTNIRPRVRDYWQQRLHHHWLQHRSPIFKKRAFLFFFSIFFLGPASWPIHQPPQP